MIEKIEREKTDNEGTNEGDKREMTGADEIRVEGSEVHQ